MAIMDKDPIDWNVNEVVEFLCNSDLLPWASSSNTPRPDPLALEDSLRENFVTGEVLLNDVDSSTLKEDFGIKALGHRSSVLRAIKWLQGRSQKYQVSQQGQPLEDQSMANLHSPPSYPSSAPVPKNTVQSDSPEAKSKRRIAPVLVQSKASPAPAHPNLDSSTRSTFDSHLSTSPLPTSHQSLQEGTVSHQNPEELFYSRLLAKYPPQENEEGLPCYGDSGSDGEYDQETWKEIEQNGPSRSTAPLPRDEYDSIVAGCILDQEARWNREELPIKLHVAPAIWYDSRTEEANRQEKDKSTLQLARLCSRLGKLKQGIMEIEHASRATLKRACSSLEQTVFQICHEKWKLSVLDEEICPPLVPRPKRVHRKRNHPQDGEDEEGEEESLVSESPTSTGSRSDDGSVDIIISDSETIGRISESSPGSRKRLPSTLASSPPSDDSEFSQPVIKRRRLSKETGHNREGVESLFVEPIDFIDLTTLVTIPESSQCLGKSHAQHENGDLKIETPPLNPTRPEATDSIKTTVDPVGLIFSDGPAAMDLETSTELAGNPEMQIETPPLNPIASIAVKEPDEGKELLGNGFPLITPFDKLVSLRQQSRKTPAPLQTPWSGQPPQSPSRPYDRTACGSDKETEYQAIFKKVGGQTLKDVEAAKVPLNLLAKHVMNLSHGELQDYPAYLNQWMDSTYRDTVHSAITSMMQNRRELGYGERHTDQLGMRLGGLFVTWFHCMRMRPDGLPREQLRTALKSIDEDPSKFSTFMETCRDLVHVYMKWIKPSPVPAPSETGDSMQSSTVPSVHEEPKGKRLPNVPGVSVLQQRAKERLKKQAITVEAFKQKRKKQGLSNDDRDGQAVTFKDPIICLPPSIGEFVKPHQLKGVQFMWRELCEAQPSQGCLLAHVMGLGKTMQVISFLVTLSEAAVSEDPQIRRQVPRKFHRSQTLVLCPASVVENWVDEFAIWAPENNHLGRIRGINAERVPNQNQHRLSEIRSWKEEGGVLILSYEMFRGFIKRKDQFSPEEASEIEDALLKAPSIVVGDEAHKLKNEKSAVSQAASRFQTQSRIAMTGSPLANNLIEYYQMLEWIAPGYLGKLDAFKEKFLVRIEAGSYIDSTPSQRRASLMSLKLLDGILSPKVNRADISVMAQDLPPKTEFVIWVSLTQVQKHAYNIFVEEAKKSGLGARLWQWLAIMQLCCNHPWPFWEKLTERTVDRKVDTTTQRQTESADSLLAGTVKDADLPPSISQTIGKLFSFCNDLKEPWWSNRALLLLQILDESKRAGDKVLIFSQSIPTMNYLDHLLQMTLRSFARIDGSSAPGNRQNLTKEFNTHANVDILLVSTRAGGVGLNMFGANRVVIFDFLFNPTLEDQAVGRAYRLGQTKPVFVYRFVGGGTFEDVIFNMTVFKSQLAARVIDRKSVLRESTNQTQEYLFPVKNVEREDCSSMLGKDPDVLDKLIKDNLWGILKVTLSRIQNDDNDQLTEAESLVVNDELQQERFKREYPELNKLLSRVPKGHPLTKQLPLSMQPIANYSLQAPGCSGTTQPVAKPTDQVFPKNDQIQHIPLPNQTASVLPLSMQPIPNYSLQAPGVSGMMQPMAKPTNQVSPTNGQIRHMGLPNQTASVQNLNLPNKNTTSVDPFFPRFEQTSALVPKPDQTAGQVYWRIPPTPQISPPSLSLPTSSGQYIQPFGPILPKSHIPPNGPGAQNTSWATPSPVPLTINPQLLLSRNHSLYPAPLSGSQNTPAESYFSTSNTQGEPALDPQPELWNVNLSDTLSPDLTLDGATKSQEIRTQAPLPPVETDQVDSTGQEIGHTSPKVTSPVALSSSAAGSPPAENDHDHVDSTGQETGHISPKVTSPVALSSSAVGSPPAESDHIDSTG